MYKIPKIVNLENFKYFQLRKFQKRIFNLENLNNFQFEKFQEFPKFYSFEWILEEKSFFHEFICLSLFI